MKKIFLIIFFYLFIIPAVFARESQDELKTYLGDMNKIVIEVEEAMRNLSMKILPAKNAVEQISAAIKKFEVLKPPLIFSKDHKAMLSAFKTIRDGLKLFSEGERKKSVELVRKGAALLKDAAIGIRTIAEQQGLIPARPKTAEPTKPILPTQAPSVIAGTSPTLSPHIASPQIETDFITTEARPSTDVNLADIPDSASILSIPRTKLTTPGQDTDLPVIFTAVGEIISIEPREDYFVVKLRDDFGNKLEIDVKPQVSNISKDNKIVGIKEVNIGEAVYILYTQSGDKNQAIFISILKPEDANALKKSMESGPFNPAILEKPTQ